MTWAISFNRQARDELQEAARYYGLESPSLRAAFLGVVESGLGDLLEHPRSAPIVRANIRRKALTRFPYSLVYALHPGKIRVLAVMHQSRRPLYWWGRN